MDSDNNQRYTSQPVVVPRAAQDEDQYYSGMLQHVTEERMWYTTDIVKMVMRATLRNGTDTASVKSIYHDLGLPYVTRKERNNG
jgi:hypothetical protein